MSDETGIEGGAEEPGGEDEAPSRIAGGCVVVILAGVAVLVMKAIVTVAPYMAYFVAGVLACLAWQRVRAWVGRRRGEPAEEDQDEQEEPDVAKALRELAGPGRNVLLTELQKKLGAPDTKAVRGLLKAAGIRVRDGVRAPAGNGPGVHQDDIPAPSPEGDGSHGDGCCCRSGNNTNANNAPSGPVGEGLRVEAIGHAGTLIHDPADLVRHHRVK